MHKIKWIHLSDLHLGDDSATDTRLMRKKLLNYIKNNNCVFDYIFCTGDIKQYNGDYQNAKEYMPAIAGCCGAPLEHFFIVPGNHDLNISCNDDRERLIKKLTNWQSGYYKSSRGDISDENLKILRSGETSFVDFITSLFGQQRADKYKDLHFVNTTEHFNIIHLNSTTTYSIENQRDFVIGTKKLMDVLESCDKTKFSIILTHYSFDFLGQDERNEVETLLSEYNVKLWLAGHEHDNLIRMQRDKFLECQCGNLVLQDGAKSCFLTGEIDIDSGKGEIMVHAWYCISASYLIQTCGNYKLVH